MVNIEMRKKKLNCWFFWKLKVKNLRLWKLNPSLKMVIVTRVGISPSTVLIIVQNIPGTSAEPEQAHGRAVSGDGT